MTALEIDTSAAEAYETHLVPGVMAPWAEVLASHVRIREGMDVLDIACGTGVAARRAAQHVGSSGRVVAIDIDPGMLEVARRVSKDQGLSIEYGCASACDLPLSSSSFDVALCLQGLQYVTHPLQAMRELRRVLRTDSALVSITWNGITNCKGHWAIVSALERRGIDATAVRKPFALADVADLQSLAIGAEFKTVSVRTEMRVSHFPSAGAFVDAMRRGATSSRHALEKVAPQDWPSFLSEVEEGLARWACAGGIEFPMESNVLVAYR